MRHVLPSPSLFARRGAILKGDSSWEIKARAPKWNGSAPTPAPLDFRLARRLSRGRGRAKVARNFFAARARELAFDTRATCRRSSYLLRAPARSVKLRPIRATCVSERTAAQSDGARYELSRPVKAGARWCAERSRDHEFPAAPR